MRAWCSVRGGHPVAVEAPRYAMLEFHPCDRLAGEVLGVEDDHLAAVLLFIVPDCQEPAVVFGGFFVARNEHRLSGQEACAEAMLFERAFLIVALQDRIEGSVGVERRLLSADEVSVAMLSSSQALVEPRELVADVVDLILPDRAVLQIQIPSPRQRRISAERVAGHV